MPADLELDALRRLLQAHPGVHLAILFGSAARGTSHARSDLDVAFLPSDAQMPLFDELRLQADLERATGRTVDLVRLDRASTLLRFRIARDGVLLAEAEPFGFARFRAAAASAYIDFAPSFEESAERFRLSLIRRAKAAGAASP